MNEADNIFFNLKTDENSSLLYYMFFTNGFD